MNISMGSAATAASTLLDNKVLITTPLVKVCTYDEFNIEGLEPAIAVEIKYVEGISGSNILILKKSDVKVILSQMMMTEMDDNFEIDELAESAICELMNQMMGSSATVLSCFLGRTINISTPATVPIGAIEDFKMEFFGPSAHVVTVAFNLSIADVMDSTFMCAMHIDLAQEIIKASMNFDTDPEPEAAPAPAAAPPPPPPAQQQAPPPPAQAPAAPPPMQAPPPPAAGQPPPAYAPPPDYGQPPPPGYGPPQGYPPQGYPPAYGPPPGYPPQGYPPYGYPAPQHAEAPVVVKDFNYADFGGAGGAGSKDLPTNLELVMGVPVVVTVELGRTKRKIKEILDFATGTIVELDKQAGSQVDVIVNGQLIARGDVVVVDDNFSIRITEILKSRDALGIV
jgi:flagellar motor switch protein FliN/FliY